MQIYLVVSPGQVLQFIWIPQRNKNRSQERFLFDKALVRRSQSQPANQPQHIAVVLFLLNRWMPTPIDVKRTMLSPPSIPGENRNSIPLVILMRSSRRRASTKASPTVCISTAGNTESVKILIVSWHPRRRSSWSRFGYSVYSVCSFRSLPGRLASPSFEIVRPFLAANRACHYQATT